MLSFPGPPSYSSAPINQEIKKTTLSGKRKVLIPVECLVPARLFRFPGFMNYIQIIFVSQVKIRLKYEVKVTS